MYQVGTLECSDGTLEYYASAFKYWDIFMWRVGTLECSDGTLEYWAGT